MLRQVHRAQVADGDLVGVGVQRDLGAQVRRVHHAHVLLRRTDVARILEGDPRVAGLEQHRQHLAPQVQRFDLLVHGHFTARRLGFIAQVGFFEGLADLVVQVRHFGRREQAPRTLLHHALHEQVRNPVRGVHVVGAAAVVAGVLAQVEEFLDVQVPGFQVAADRALALAALVDRHRGVVGDLQERHHALRFAVGALDARAHRADRGPVVAQAAGELRQQRVFLDGVVDGFQVVANSGQVARRQLRAAGARVEQGRGRAHEVEARQQVVELDRARFAVLFAQRQAHRDTHVEGLRHLDAGFADVQEVAVVQGLQADVAELQVAVGDDRLGQLLQVELAQFLVQQLGGYALGDVLREVGHVFGGGAGLRDFLAEDFLTDGVQQDARGDLAVGRVLFHQRAGSQDRRLVQLFDRHAVVQVLDGFGQDGVGIDVLFQAHAGGADQGRHFVHVQRAAHAAVDHGELRRGHGGGARGFLGGAALVHALGAVQHVFARDVMLARAHQGQLHLVLHIFDVEGAAVRLAAHQGGDHVVRQLLDQFADACRLAGALAVHGEESLGHGDGDLGRCERHHGAVAADDAVVAIRDQLGRASAGCRTWLRIDGDVRRCLH